ncbi:LiaF domain-containing protein [Bacillus sp. AL-1R]
MNTGASKTNLDLRGLDLNKLEIEAGVGELNVNLGGQWNKSFDANIETGLGKTTIVLPSDVGVKINLSKGIGKANIADFISKGNGVYVNEAYENADVKLTINMDLGVGEVNFKVD